MIKAPFLPEFSSSSSALSLLMLGRCHGNDMKRPATELCHFLWDTTQLTWALVILVSGATKRKHLKNNRRKIFRYSLPFADRRSQFIPRVHIGASEGHFRTRINNEGTYRTINRWSMRHRCCHLVEFCISSGKVAKKELLSPWIQYQRRKQNHKEGNKNKTGIFVLMFAITAAIPFAFMQFALPSLSNLFIVVFFRARTWMDDCSEQEGQGVTRTKRLVSWFSVNRVLNMSFLQS